MQRLMVFPPKNDQNQKWKKMTWGATDFSWFLGFTIQFLGYPILTHTPKYARANIKTTSSQVHFKMSLHPCRRQLHPLALPCFSSIDAATWVAPTKDRVRNGSRLPIESMSHPSMGMESHSKVDGFFPQNDEYLEYEHIGMCILTCWALCILLACWFYVY